MVNWLHFRGNSKGIADSYASLERTDDKEKSPGISIIDHVARALVATYNVLSIVGMIKYKGNEMYYGEALNAINRVLRQEQFRVEMKSMDPLELARRELKEAIEELGKRADNAELAEDKRMCAAILDKLKNNGERWPDLHTLMLAYVMLKVEINNSLGRKIWFGTL
ncbi:MAG: hypothetical protein M1360_01220 [Candidatus Marsarchaeota archaeon]|jgi:hypothetical protein|nr:hypothetical protein [Candidatus Marsarchaeota archaeon]MCL5418541.1 hypothetical protein [Candidatus Marsarchaeota archaeon]